MINANRPKVQQQPCISSAGLTQGYQPVHRCALDWQGVDHRTAPAGKKKPNGRESPQLAKQPHDKSEPSDNRDLRPRTSSGTSAHVALHHNRTRTGRAGHCRPIKARTRAACRGRGLSQLPLHVNSFSRWSSAKSRPPSPRISVRKRRSAYPPVTRRVAQQTGGKLASSPFPIFGTPTLTAGSIAVFQGT